MALPNMAMIPSGYKPTKLYSVLPTPSYGSELVTNGDFATNLIGWSNKSATSSWVSGSARVDNSSGNSISGIFQNVGLVLGKTYKLKATLKLISGDSNGNLTVLTSSAQGSGQTIIYTGDALVIGGASVTEEIQFTIADSDVSIQLACNTTNAIFEIDNVSVKEVLVGNADFDVTRATPATRVNQYGLIETPEFIVSGELITNGDFSNGSTDWSLGSGWTIANGVATFDGLNNAKRIFQSVSFVQNKNYKISFDVTQTDDDFISLFFGQNATQLIGTKNYKVGSYELYAEASVTTENLSIYAYNTTYGGGSVDNISVVQVERNNIPRLDYTDGGCPVLLTEPQSTNLITNSDLSNWSGGRATINQSANTSPSGENNAIALVATAVTNDHFVNTTPSFPLGEVTYSVFAKAADKGWIRLWETTTNVSANFDITNGVVGSAFGSVTDTSIKDYGNGWYRCSMTYSTLSASSKSARVYAVPNDLSKVYLGDGVTEDVYLWGAQIEELSYATSYIPTNGSTVTRNQDVVNNAGTSATYNSEEGVLFAEIAALANDGVNRRISLSDGSAVKRALIYFDATNNISALVRISGVTSFGFTFAADITQLSKVALKWKQDDFALWVDGVEVGASTSGNTFATDDLNTLSFADGDGASLHFFGKTSQVQVFNTALSNFDLLNLTSNATGYATYETMRTSLNFNIQ